MMKVVEFEPRPFFVVRFLNAGHSQGGFFEDQLPVHHARVEKLPEGLRALVATADLQGRETFRDSHGGPLRLLGEVLPQRLVEEILPRIGVDDSSKIGALLAGDFYTVPALDKRGGTGNVTSVWDAFRANFAWVAGVAGNHDLFDDLRKTRPDYSDPTFFLEGDCKEISGLKIAGLGGIIGKPSKPQRRTDDDYLEALNSLLPIRPDILLMHEGPDGCESDQPGNLAIRSLLQDEPPGLVIRGHKHWESPFANFSCGLQVLNVDARVVVLTE